MARTPRLPKDIARGQLDWIVDAHHVADRNVTVIRGLRRRMNAPGWTKAKRKAAYRYAIHRHANNRKLCVTVYRGF